MQSPATGRTEQDGRGAAGPDRHDTEDRFNFLGLFMFGRHDKLRNHHLKSSPIIYLFIYYFLFVIV